MVKLCGFSFFRFFFCFLFSHCLAVKCFVDKPLFFAAVVVAAFVSEITNSCR